MDLHRIHSHKYFRGGKVQKSFLLGFCIFTSVLFRDIQLIPTLYFLKTAKYQIVLREKWSWRII